MLYLNENVILRQEENSALLFDLNSGTMTRINQTGAIIWQGLKNGLSEKEIVEVFMEQCPEIAVESLEKEIHHFLALLAGKSYISGFEGELIPPDYDEELVELPGNRAIYELNSMRSIFTPGDALVFTDCPFAQFKIGDIIIFYPNGVAATGVVHRIIKRTADNLITMGDDNPVRDQAPVTLKEHPKLVTAKVRPDGKHFKIYGGFRGLLTFYFNRVSYFGMKIIVKILHPFLPWMFWRKSIDTVVEFDNMVQYYYRGRLVGKRAGDQLEYLPKWKQFFYKILN